MRAALLIPLLVIAPGCFGASVSEAGEPGAPLPTVELLGCDNFGANFPAPYDDASALLPEGWRPVLSSASPQRTAVVWVIGVECERAIVDGLDVGAARIGYVELSVTPPAEYREEGLADYVVPLFVVAEPRALGDAFAALRLGASGPGRVDATSLSGSDRSFAYGSGDRLVELRGSRTPEAISLGAGDFRVFGIQDREVVSFLDGHTTEATGTRALTTVKASEAVPLVGASAARGFSAQGFDYTLRPV